MQTSNRNGCWCCNPLCVLQRVYVLQPVVCVPTRCMWPVGFAWQAYEREDVIRLLRHAGADVPGT